jgi:adenylosuccinate lyase
MSDPVNNISPLDGRYGSKVEDLRPYFSESALMKYRVKVEVEWFIFLCNEVKLKGTRVWQPTELQELRGIYEYFDAVSANRVKAIEKTTNHDVKAIEYFIKENLKESAFEPYLEFIHFGCTSEDINNLSYALMLKGAIDGVALPVLYGLEEKIHELAMRYADIPMMARTHGQPASPTTLGKELINFLARVERQAEGLSEIEVMGKINGAVGNYNAHIVAYPNIDWLDVSKKFVQKLGLKATTYTTQIEPHDFYAEIFDAFRRLNTIIIDMDRDIWTYISMGYFKQRLKKGEVGSSTMPHKVNPIDFENSEGNLGMANAMFGHFSEKLPVSRMQRDLTDSTVMRNIGSAIGYSLLAYKNCIQGLGKLELNKAALKADLDDNWELMAEPIQTVLRKYKVTGAYEKLKDLTRGKTVTKAVMARFITGLPIPEAEKKKLKELSPSKYIGLASKLVAAYKPLYTRNK